MSMHGGRGMLPAMCLAQRCVLAGQLQRLSIKRIIFGDVSQTGTLSRLAASEAQWQCASLQQCKYWGASHGQMPQMGNC